MTKLRLPRPYGPRSDVDDGLAVTDGVIASEAWRSSACMGIVAGWPRHFVPRDDGLFSLFSAPRRRAEI